MAILSDGCPSEAFAHVVGRAAMVLIECYNVCVSVLLLFCCVFRRNTMVLRSGQTVGHLHRACLCACARGIKGHESKREHADAVAGARG